MQLDRFSTIGKYMKFDMCASLIFCVMDIMALPFHNVPVEVAISCLVHVVIMANHTCCQEDVPQINPKKYAINILYEKAHQLAIYLGGVALNHL